MKHIHFKSIDSTNLYLKKNHHQFKHLTIASADMQTGGYGRNHTPWVSSKDSATFSLLIKHKITANSAPLMPLLSAIAVHKVLMHYEHDLLIKWPNDITYHDKKCAGILCESVSLNDHFEALIIGIGININQTSFKSPLKHKAISLQMMTHHTYVISVIIKKCVKAIKKEIKAFQKGSLEYISYLNHYHALKDHMIEVQLNDLVIKGQAKDMTFKGHLELLTPDGFIEIDKGSIIKIYPK